MLALCAVGLAINYPLAKVPLALDSPLYLDNVGSALGSVLTWVLYGFEFDASLSAPLARRILDAGRMSPFWSQFTADMLIGLADKAITVSVVAIMLYALPQPTKHTLYYAGWQQTPLTRKKLMAADHKRARRMSLRSKILLLVAAAMVIVAGAATIISFIHFRDAAIDEQTKLAYGVAKVASDAIGADRVDEFIAQGHAAEGYARVDKRFNDLANSAEEIEYVYTYKILEDGCPFENAMDIIREGSGNHFDPKIVDAFFRARDEVLRVMNTHMGG